MTDLPFDPRFAFQYGQLEIVRKDFRRIVACNPGPFTGPGTGTYVIGRGEVAVLDPGPWVPAHVDALLDGLGGETVSHIIVTHSHVDHSPASRLLKQRTGAPILAYGPHPPEMAGNPKGGFDREFVPDITVRDGETIRGNHWTLEAIHTPGHCSNHLCFAWPEADTLFCGDQVMAWATPVIMPPDGSVRDYLDSLERLSWRPEKVFFPTHGAPIREPKPLLAQVHTHRLDRVAQVAAAVDDGCHTLSTMRERIYPDIPQSLHAGAELSLLASIIYLRQQGHHLPIEDEWRRHQDTTPD